MKKTFRAHSDQMFLLPPSVKDFVPEDHPAQFVRRIVQDELDLREIEVKYIETRGAPPFSPEVMTGLLLYGYMRGVFSSRQLARGCLERLDFKLITGMHEPDFRTIAKFRKDHSEALKALFVQVVKLCAEAKIVDLKHVALDGTKIKASASKDKSIRYKDLKKKEKELQEEVDTWMEEADRQDKEEDEKYGEDDRGDGFLPADKALEKYREAKKRLENRIKAEHDEQKRAEKNKEVPRRHSRKKIVPDEDDRENLVDPDSRVMKSRGAYIQAYNCQVSVDRKRHVIVSTHVTSSGTDYAELAPALDQLQDTFNRYPEEFSADTGYFSEHNLKILEDRKINAYVAAGRDPSDRKRKPPPPESLSHKMITRLKKAGKRSRYRIRKETVETVIGNIKQARGFRQFLLRGKKMVETEFSLVCSGHNLWKLFQYRVA